jgi:hypothetical protein
MRDRRQEPEKAAWRGLLEGKLEFWAADPKN